MVRLLTLLLPAPARLPLKWLGQIMRIKILRWAAYCFPPVSQIHFMPVVTIVLQELKMAWLISATLFDRLVTKS